MRAVILVADSFGIGAAPDAARFGDEGADTCGHIAASLVETDAARAGEGREPGPLRVPNLEALGLGLAYKLVNGHVPAGFAEEPRLIGAYGAARALSTGKDTPSGHWEMAGVPVRFSWGYFEKEEDSFPPDLLGNLVRRAGLPGWLGNCRASGTEIIARLGGEHIRSGRPIFYTSADSVFQIACHEESFGLERLYDLCRIAFEEVRPWNICRVIARPFAGTVSGGFRRTGNRRDFAVPPPAPTLLQKLAEAGGEVVSVGKIADIFAGAGITRAVKATGIEALWDATLDAVRRTGDRSLVMTNFVDFDQNWGHRRDAAGYAAGLEAFDKRLPEILALLGDDDIMALTADHGCDPTWKGTDHTREYVPLLVYGKKAPAGPLGVRATFADLGQSLAAWFGLAPFPDGESFLAG